MLKPYNVLFVCAGNSARSILAEGLLRGLGNGRFNAYSAGSQPTGQVHPLALAMLDEHGFATDGMYSKSWNEFLGPDAPVLDFIFTVSDQAAGEIRLRWPMAEITANWSVPDPAAIGGGEPDRRRAFLDAYERLARPIRLFAGLSFNLLDRMALTWRLDSAGRLREEPPVEVQR